MCCKLLTVMSMLCLFYRSTLCIVLVLAAIILACITALVIVGLFYSE
jgi:hypothetical protein